MSVGGGGGGWIACVCQRFRAMTVTKFIAPTPTHPPNTRPLPATRRDHPPLPPPTICLQNYRIRYCCVIFILHPPPPTPYSLLRRVLKQQKCAPPYNARYSLMKRECLNIVIIIFHKHIIYVSSSHHRTALTLTMTITIIIKILSIL